MELSILHISDLHRDSGSVVTTASLLESLRLDRSRHLAKGLIAPHVAVVSGDIVYGVTDESQTGELQRQYEEALGLLIGLADEFFNGDRERVILIPGNHDVSHPHVLRSLAPVPLPKDPTKRRILAEQLREIGSPLRWDARDFVVRRIDDPETYARRFEPFAGFYERFYEGRRTFPIEPDQQVGVHCFPELDLIVVGYSSCCDNDLFNRSGRVHGHGGHLVVRRPIRSAAPLESEGSH
jgi:hypothetical protein